MNPALKSFCINCCVALLCTITLFNIYQFNHFFCEWSL